MFQAPPLWIFFQRRFANLLHESADIPYHDYRIIILQSIPKWKASFQKGITGLTFFVIHISIDLYFAEKTKRFTREGQKCLLNILIDIFFHIIINFLYASIYISSSHRFFQHLQLSSPLSYLHQFLPTVNFDLRL